MDNTRPGFTVYTSKRKFYIVDMGDYIGAPNEDGDVRIAIGTRKADIVADMEVFVAAAQAALEAVKALPDDPRH